ncbi:DNA helicase [Octadecabacter Antarctic BD virus 1]|nr:DNA helicase [Octadecabacter Antarctic BD virus 1]
MRNFDDLRTDQQSGIDALYENNALYIVMRMGGGKTATCLTAISELIRDGHIRKAIVMAPPLVAATVWPKECAKWEHLSHLKVVPLIGSPAKRLKLLRESDADVFSVSDGVVKWLVDLLLTLPANHPLLDLFAYDEPKLKAPRGQMKKQLVRIGDKMKFKWLFSGTPRPNGYEDLYGPASFLKPDLWSSDFDKWRRRNFMPLDFNGYNWEVHDFRAVQLDEGVKTFMVQAAEPADARHGTLSDGPDFDFEIDLPPEAMKLYKDMERDLIVEVLGRFDHDIGLSEEEHIAEMVAALTQAVASSKLSQIAQGFLYGNMDGERNKTTTEVHTAKIDALEYQLDAIGAENTVITYGFRPDVDAIEGLLKKQGRKYGLLGKGVSIKQKMKYVDQWNEGRLDNLILHPASAGHGVELQFGGRRMIHYCLTWSAELLDQVMKRLDRHGQERQVYSHMLVAKGTVDVVKRNRTYFKMSDQDAFKELLRTL